MSLGTLLVMVLYLAVVWGLLLVATIHLARTKDEAIGTLGTRDLDDLPQYTAPAASSAAAPAPASSQAIDT